MKLIHLSSLVILLVIGFSLTMCTLGNENTQNTDNELKYAQNEKSEIPFNLNKADLKIKLNNELQEVSALSYHENNKLACLHDENADIFMVDYQIEAISEKLEVAGNGDYEGIEIIDHTVYMLKSNGQLLKISNFTDATWDITELKTELSSRNDCEGLGYDPETKQLLIACKENPNLKAGTNDYKGSRAIYEFDIITEKLNITPKYLINLKEIEEKTGKKEFMPSGIATHPLTHNIYIVASAGKLIIVLNRSGQIIDFEHLNPNKFQQPEGICFSPDGRKLFISNEGKKKKANILMFNALEN